MNTLDHQSGGWDVEGGLAVGRIKKPKKSAEKENEITRKTRLLV